MCQLQSLTSAEAGLGTRRGRSLQLSHFRDQRLLSRKEMRKHMVWWEEVTVAVKIKKYNEKQTFCGVLPLEMQCQRAGAGGSGAVCAKGNQTGLKTGAVNRDEPWEGNCLLSGMFFP